MSVTVDTRGFEKFCRDAARQARIPKKQMVQLQTAKTMETAIRYTPSTKPAKAKDQVAHKVLAKFNTFADGYAGTKDTVLAGERFRGARGRDPRISISQRKGRVWMRKDGRWLFMGGNGTPRKWSPDTWGEYERMEAQRRGDMNAAGGRVLASVRASIGLGKRSWWDSCEQLGIGHLMKVPAFVKKAIPSNRKLYTNGTGKDKSSGYKTLLVVINHSPLMQSKGRGIKILSNAINTRLSAMKRDMRNGVFLDHQKLAARYPGIILR